MRIDDGLRLYRNVELAHVYLNKIIKDIYYIMVSYIKEILHIIKLLEIYMK